MIENFAALMAAIDGPWDAIVAITLIAAVAAVAIFVLIAFASMDD